MSSSMHRIDIQWREINSVQTDSTSAFFSSPYCPRLIVFRARDASFVESAGGGGDDDDDDDVASFGLVTVC